jgi:hypothetical protein
MGPIGTLRDRPRGISLAAPAAQWWALHRTGLLHAPARACTHAHGCAECVECAQSLGGQNALLWPFLAVQCSAVQCSAVQCSVSRRAVRQPGRIYHSNAQRATCSTTAMRDGHISATCSEHCSVPRRSLRQAARAPCAHGAAVGRCSRARSCVMPLPCQPCTYRPCFLTPGSAAARPPTRKAMPNARAHNGTHNMTRDWPVEWYSPGYSPGLLTGVTHRVLTTTVGLLSL